MEREGYGGPRDVTSLSLSMKRAKESHARRPGPGRTRAGQKPNTVDAKNHNNITLYVVRDVPFLVEVAVGCAAAGRVATIAKLEQS